MKQSGFLRGARKRKSEGEEIVEMRMKGVEIFGKIFL